MQNGSGPSTENPSRSLEYFRRRLSSSLRQKVLKTGKESTSKTRILACCTLIFVVATGTRWLHLQDRRLEITESTTSLIGLFERYRREAHRMMDEGRILFPLETSENRDARLLIYPPGYSMLLAAIYKFTDNPNPALWTIQIICDALEAVMVFLIGGLLLNRWIGFIAGLLCALSPHLSYYSLVLSPDSLPVLPILIAVLMLLRAIRRPRLVLIIVAGALVGISLWLRGNALLLSPFIALVILLVFDKTRRLRYALAFVAATALVIAPITIRNWVLFHRFIPLTLQAGLSLVEGIGDYDSQKRFNMPASDRESRLKDAEWHSRPDYASNLWAPDGIERDEYRFQRGLQVIRSNPGWFSKVLAERTAFILAYNDSRTHPAPRSTANVPPVLTEPPFGHQLDLRTADDSERSVLIVNGNATFSSAKLDSLAPQWSATAAELLANGVTLTNSVSIAPVESRIRISGDDSDYGDQFTSGPMPVKRRTDYVLSIAVKRLRGDAGVKVTSSDRRIALGIASLANAEPDSEKELASKNEPTDSETTTIQMPFATGNRSTVRLVLSNNGSRPVFVVGEAHLFELGATPASWTAFIRPVIRAVQRKPFTTGWMWVLIGAGILVLAIASQWRALAILLIVPLYYVCSHAPLHMEYRYTLAIHYFLFVVAATGVFIAASALRDILRILLARIRGNSWRRDGARDPRESAQSV